MRKILALGGILLLCGGLLLYQQIYSLKAVESPLESAAEQEYTTEGFEEPEEAVGYLLYQIQQQDLDGALRVCAVGDVAEYFNMTSYLNYTESFEGMDFIPPPDMENRAYIEIVRCRMAYEYASWIETCRAAFSEADEIEILKVQIVEPENPDGMYYTRMRAINGILGCSDLCEMSAYISVDGSVMELRFSVAKYRSYWRVLMFNYLDGYPDPEPYIRRTKLSPEEIGEPWDLQELEEVVLPPNYYVLETVKEEDPQILLEHFFLYLQQDDSLSAMSYFSKGGTGEEQTDELAMLERQSDIAKAIQNFYYQMFFYDPYTLEWAERHFNDFPETIPETLDTKEMIVAYLNSMTLLEQSDYREVWEISYSYASQWFTKKFVLVNENGWMIESME